MPTTYPTGASVGNVVDDGAVDGEAVMEGVEHLGQYVYEMTRAKVDALKAGGGQMPVREIKMLNGGDAHADEDDRPENVLIPEELAEDDGEDDEV